MIVARNDDDVTDNDTYNNGNDNNNDYDDLYILPSC